MGAYGLYLTPFEFFTERTASTPFSKLQPLISPKDFPNLTCENLEMLADTQNLHAAINAVHKEVINPKKALWEKARAIHNACTNVLPITCISGDYMLVHRSEHHAHKFETKCVGSTQVIRAVGSSLFEEVELLKTKKEIEHRHRLRFYSPIQTGKITSEALGDHALYLHKTYHVV